MTIAVSTPTGQVGTHVVRALLASGERPRVLLRHPAKLPDEIAAAVDVVELDQGDEDAVIAATEGVRALFWVDPPTDDDDPAAGYARMGRAGAAAVAHHRIPRTVFLSSIGAEVRHGAGEIDGLGWTEDLLDEVAHERDVSVTHLRAGFLFSNVLMDLPAVRAEGVWRTPWPPEQPMAWVAPRDVAEVAAGRLLSSAWSGREVQAVHGPEHLSFVQVAAVLAERLGREVQVRQIDEERFREQLRALGLSEGQVDGLAGMPAGLAHGFVAEDPRTAGSTTPTTFASWAAENVEGPEPG